MLCRPYLITEKLCVFTWRVLLHPENASCINVLHFVINVSHYVCVLSDKHISSLFKNSTLNKDSCIAVNRTIIESTLLLFYTVKTAETCYEKCKTKCKIADDINIINTIK